MVGHDTCPVNLTDTFRVEIKWCLWNFFENYKIPENEIVIFFLYLQTSDLLVLCK